LLQIREDRAYFWRTHTGAELDLLADRGRQRLGYEIKRTSAPRQTPSMRSAIEDLALQELVVVHAGEHSYPMAKRVRAVAGSRLLDDI
jgi:predicted AAA+ superfamily ATPase